MIDSPGILDHPLEERNTIEMQSITALAHLKACILFFIDISESCGYTIDQQISLFNNIKPLFLNKPVLIVFSKIDLQKFLELPIEDQEKLKKVLEQEGMGSVEMSNKSGEGINIVKTKACDQLLNHRINQKAEALAGGSMILKREEDFLKGMHISLPKKRDNKERPSQVPEGVTLGEKKALNRPTLKQIQEQCGGAGVFNFPLQGEFI